MFRTVKHPKEEAVQFAIGAKPMPDAEKKRSVELTNAILQKRGREALRSDDAAGDANSEGFVFGADGVIRRRPVAESAPAAGLRTWEGSGASQLGVARQPQLLSMLPRDASPTSASAAE